MRLNQKYLLKNWFFWLNNPYKNEVVEILELPNFVLMTMSTIQYEPRDKILLVTSHRKTMTS